MEVHVITTLLRADLQARSGRPAGGDATRLFLSQVAYLIHDDFEILMLDSVLVGPGVRVELSGKEDFLTKRGSLQMEIPHRHISASGI